jgi:ADP-heptose:LPS heptosyltransferase
MSAEYFPGPDVEKGAGKRCLVIELWWIGDATLMTSILQGLLDDGWNVTVLGKAQTRVLLETSYPEVKWIEFNAPWTAFHHKYQLWRWPWAHIVGVLRQMRQGRFDATVSIRKDPRDHFFFWLANVPRRIGFSTPFSNWFLTQAIPILPPNHHRVEDWWEVQECLSPTATRLHPPRLTADPEPLDHYRAIFARDGRAVLALHCGARNAVRRWPEAYFRELVTSLREQFDFQLALFPDTDGYGTGLADLAQNEFHGLSLAELKGALACASLLLGNDSGPGHLADALGVPVIAIFGPGDPHKMRPFGKRNLVVMRDICPYHPCSDYCRFPEPYCLTQLTPALIGPQIRSYLLETALLPTLSRPSSPQFDIRAATNQVN